MLFTPRQKFRLLNWHRYERFVRVLGPVFWQPCRNASGSISTNAAYSSGTGPELFTNPGGVGTPFTFSSDNPASWTLGGESGDDPEISEVAAGEGHADSPTPGGGYVNIYSGAASPNVGMSQDVQTVGDTFQTVIDVNRVVSGSIVRAAGNSGGANIGSPITSAGINTFLHIATTAALGLKRGGANTDVTIAGYSAKKFGSIDGLIAGTTSLAQTGLLGINEAFLFDGVTSLITVYNRAAIQGLTAFTLWELFKPSSAGEGDAGTLFSKSGEFELRFNSASRDLIASVNYSGTNAQRVTSTTLDANEWHTVGMRIDNSGKTPEIFVDGVEASYASTTVGVGTRVSNTNNLIVGNNAAVSQTLAGLLDEFLLVDHTLTANELRLLHLLSGLD
jgi:hypothetical protein